jgi:beta propeller repeat protein
MKHIPLVALALSLAACTFQVEDDGVEAGEALGEREEPISFACRWFQGDPGCFMTAGTEDEMMPRISGTRVVWVANRSGYWGIHYRDVGTNAPAAEITPPFTQNVIPDIDGDRVVYARLPPDPQPWNFIGYDLNTGVETVFYTLPRHFGLGWFSVHGERVVFTGVENGNFDVYMYDFTTSQLRRITTDPARQTDARIRGNRISWVDQRHGGTWFDLYVHDLLTNTTQRITQNSTLGRAAVLSDTRMVWGDVRGGYFKLYEYDFYANPPERALPTQTLVENSLAMSSTIVAWVNRNDANPVFYDDVFVYDIITNEERRVTKHAARQWFPALSVPYLVWEDSRRGNADILIEQLGTIFD